MRSYLVTKSLMCGISGSACLCVVIQSACPDCEVRFCSRLLHWLLKCIMLLRALCCTSLSPALPRRAVLCCAVLQGDAEAITSMLQYGRQILSQVVDDNRRRWAQHGTTQHETARHSMAQA
jgi:hypothetical protein